MSHETPRLSRTLPAALALCLLLAGSGVLAQFLETDVEILASHATEAVGDSFGWVGTELGDINGDGALEYIVTSPFNNEGGAAAGKIYVYSGADGSLLATQLGVAFDTLGFGIAAGGDFNADGAADYAAGGPAVFGGGNGKVVFYSGADHTVLHTVEAPIRNLLGYDLGIAGDVNGDGHDDLIAGAITESISAPAAGRISILSGADASVIWAADGNGAVALLGGGVSGLCDLNGDGVPEQAAAAFRAGNQGSGRAYVYNGADGALLMTLRPNGTGAGAFGQFFVHNAGDVDADGLCDVYVGDFSDATGGRGYVFSGADGKKLRQVNAETAVDGLGMGRGAGDVDGDGHDDLLIGAYTSPAAAVQGGKVRLISGKNGQVRRTFTGTVAIAQLGFDVVTLGDVNGDGIGDFLITGNEVAHVVAGTELEANGDN